MSASRTQDGLLGRWRQLWGRAGVEQTVSIDETNEEAQVRVRGFFSLTASHSKGSQYICQSPQQRFGLLPLTILPSQSPTPATSPPPPSTS